MSNMILSEYQAACRAAHEQVQLLADLYEHLSSRAPGAVPAVDLQQRLAALKEFREVLAAELKRQDLLPSQPDPEKEEALEFLTELKGRYTAEEHRAVQERLLSEERTLLQFSEQVLKEDARDALRKCHSQTQDAIRRLHTGGSEEGGA